MSPCKEDIYINLPSRYRLPKGKVLKLKKYIYRLRQSAFHWHQLFSKWLANHGFENIDSDGVTWVKTDTDDRPFIVLTETKFSLRCIPVWIGTPLTGLGSKKKHM
jgi:hypothetical protein